MAEETKTETTEVKTRGAALKVPEDVLVEMKEFSATSGIVMPRLKEIVGEAAFSLVRGNVAKLYQAKVFGDVGEDVAEEEAKPAAAAAKPAGRPMGT